MWAAVAQEVEWAVHCQKAGGSIPWGACQSILDKDIEPQITSSEQVGTLQRSLCHQCVNVKRVVEPFGQSSSCLSIKKCKSLRNRLFSQTLKRSPKTVVMYLVNNSCKKDKCLLYNYSIIRMFSFMHRKLKVKTFYDMSV